MIALRRRDVAELNALARALMETHGRLGRERLQLGAARVRARRPSRLPPQLGRARRQERNARNGRSRSTANAARSRADRPRRPRRARPLPISRRATSAMRYALTGHAAQGVTVDRAFVLGSGDARLQEWGYVALSRAREETRLYVTGEPARAREPRPRPRRPRPGHRASRRRSRSQRSSGSPSTSDRFRRDHGTTPALRSTGIDPSASREGGCG